jgi:ATP-dependent Zn protease
MAVPTAGQACPAGLAAEATRSAIDGEVSRLLRQAEERAVELLTEHRSERDALADLLLARETVDGSDVYLLAGRRAVPPAGSGRLQFGVCARCSGDVDTAVSRAPRRW